MHSHHTCSRPPMAQTLSFKYRCIFFHLHFLLHFLFHSLYFFIDLHLINKLFYNTHCYISLSAPYTTPTSHCNVPLLAKWEICEVKMRSSIKAFILELCHPFIVSAYLLCIPGQWQHWRESVQEYNYPRDSVPEYSSILVPNVDNVRTDFLISTVAKQHKVCAHVFHCLRRRNSVVLMAFVQVHWHFSSSFFPMKQFHLFWCKIYIQG